MSDSIVYLYGYSPTLETKLNTLLEILIEQINLGFEITIILIHDGVIGTSKKGIAPGLLKKLFNLPVEICAIISDIKARGMDPNSLNDNVKAIRYDDLVDILVATKKIVSWM